MKYLLLVWTQLWRNPRRTSFTIGAAAIAFLLFGVLKGFNQVMESAIDDLDARLFISSKYSRESLPIGYASRIQQLPGITGVAHMTYFGGYYQDKRVRLPVFATNPGTMFKLYEPLFQIAPEQLAAMQTTRSGAIVPESLAQRLNWKLGDVVVLNSSVWTKSDRSNAYEVKIVGTFKHSEGAQQGLAGTIFLNYDYLNEARVYGKDAVQYYIAGLADPTQATALSKAIDAQFANSPHETRTMTEQALLQRQLSSLTDLSTIVNAIVGAVFFSLLFVTGSTMMQSVRERVPELAVLKAMGFTNSQVMALVLGEALALCLSAALLGLLVARMVFSVAGDLLAKAGIPLEIALAALGIAALLAAATGLPPAWRAGRLTITGALALRR